MGQFLQSRSDIAEAGPTVLMVTLDCTQMNIPPLRNIINQELSFSLRLRLGPPQTDAGLGQGVMADTRMWKSLCFTLLALVETVCPPFFYFVTLRCKSKKLCDTFPFSGPVYLRWHLDAPELQRQSYMGFVCFTTTIQRLWSRHPCHLTAFVIQHERR